MSTTPSPQRILISRRRLFSTAHLYRQSQFSEAENKAHFGACFTPYGHGHNYQLEAFIEGAISPATGLVMNLTDLDRLLAEVVQPLDHHHANFEVPEFADTVPTTENLALYLRERLSTRLSALDPNLRLKKIRLFETDDLWVECE